MAMLTDVQRKWINEFLGSRRRLEGAADLSPLPSNGAVNPGIGITTKPFDGHDGAVGDQILPQSNVLSASPTKSPPSGDQTKYPGRRTAPKEAYPNKPEPNANMKAGAAEAKEAVARDPYDPKSVWDQNTLKNNPKLDQTVKEFQAKQRGNTVRDLDLSGKTPEQLDEYLTKLGFKHRREPLKLFSKDGVDYYRLIKPKIVDGKEVWTTTNPKDADCVAHDIYFKEDGIVRVKPEGDPTGRRAEPHVSKSVIYDKTIDPKSGWPNTDFNNEMVKVTNNGHLVPKAPTSAAGMKQGPGGPVSPDVIEGYLDGAMTAAHTDLPKSSPPPPHEEPKKAFDAAKFQAVALEWAQKVTEWNKKVEEFRKKQVEADPAGTDEKLNKEAKALEAELKTYNTEADKLAKLLETAPELEGFRGKTPRETFDVARARFSEVAGAGEKVGGFYMTLLNAASIISDVQYVFDADSTIEGIGRAIVAGKNYAVGMVEYELAAYVVGSGGAAIVVTMLLGMCSDQAGSCQKQEEAEQKAKQVKELARQKHRAIAQIMAKVAPGSVTIFDPNQGEAINNVALYNAIEKRVDELAKKQRLKAIFDVGVQDGLIGQKILKDHLDTGVDADAPLAPKSYDAGYKEGDKKKIAAIKRAEETGMADGRDGKPANFEPIKSWPELKELLQRDLLHKGTNDQLYQGQHLYNLYENAYNAGYEKGKTIVVTKLEITPNVISMGAYTSRTLVVTGIYSDNSRKELTAAAAWQSSKPNVVDVTVDNGVAIAGMLKKGTAKITASVSINGRTVPGEASVTVTEPTIAIRGWLAGFPANIPEKFKVNDKTRFVAVSEDKNSNVFQISGLGNLVTWKSDSSAVSIDQDGNATMVKAGKAVIMASDKNSSAVGKAKVTVSA